MNGLAPVIVKYLKFNKRSLFYIYFSDGQYVTYNVALHPYCQITFNKTQVSFSVGYLIFYLFNQVNILFLQWKTQNSGKSPEKVLASYRFPVIKVIGKLGIPYWHLFFNYRYWRKKNDILKILLYRMDLPLQCGKCSLFYKIIKVLEVFKIKIVADIDHV